MSKMKRGDKSKRRTLRAEGRADSIKFAEWGNKLLLACLEQVIRELQTLGIFHEPEWTHCCALRKEILSRMSDDTDKLQEFPLARPALRPA
jgi:hypothetical protein